jgi:penicillin-binding protein 2
VRTYPFNVAAHVLGYIREVDSPFLKNHKDEGYQMGDYAGRTGLESFYEKVLMGQRGVRTIYEIIRAACKGKYENGIYDTAAVAGKTCTWH